MDVTRSMRAALRAACAIAIMLGCTGAAPAETAEIREAAAPPAGVVIDAGAPVFPWESAVTFDPRDLGAPVLLLDSDGGLRANDCSALGAGANPISSKLVWVGDVIGIGPTNAGKRLMELQVELASATQQTLNLTFTVYKMNRALPPTGTKYEPLAIKTVNGKVIGPTPTLISSGTLISNGQPGVLLTTDVEGDQSFEGKYAIGVGWNSAVSVIFRRDTGVQSFPLGTVAGYWAFASAPPAPGSTAEVSIPSPVNNLSMYLLACVKAPDGACCLPPPNATTCVMSADKDTCAAIGGQFTQAGMACAPGLCPLPQSACCVGESCDFTNEFACADQGGIWTEGRNCAPYNPCGEARGACCELDGSCVDERTQLECESGGGTWHGPIDSVEQSCDMPSVQATCQPRGACCLPGGGCNVRVASACNPAQGQIYKGDGTSCPAPGSPPEQSACSQVRGACCLYNGSCAADVTYYECANQFGTPGIWHASSTCAASGCQSLGSCCAGTEVCNDQTQTQCFDCRAKIGNPLSCPAGYQEATSTNGIVNGCSGATPCGLIARIWNESEPCAYGACRDPILGACCRLGECDITNSFDCAQSGGSFHAATGTSGFKACSTNGYPAACAAETGNTGACCQTTAQGLPFCELLSAAACAATSNGVFAGEGVGCSGIVCAERTCCDIALACTTETAAQCENNDGTPGPAGTSCSSYGYNPCLPAGACCAPDGSCSLTNANGCAPQNYHGDDSICSTGLCPAIGACCIGSPTAVCSNGLTEQQCQTRSGIFQGGATTCTPGACDVGGCCEITGMCTDGVQRAACDAKPGADFLGAGVDCGGATCLPRGACCVGSSCTEETAADCNTSGGAYHGDGVACAADSCDKVPCCVDGAGCKEIYLFECASSTGLSGPIGGSCTVDYCTPGACCIGSPTAVCSNGLNDLECQAASGMFKGAGTTCQPDSCGPVLGVCCVPPGTCDDNGGSLYTQTACEAIPGGVFTAGGTCPIPGCTTSCADHPPFDFDSNGKTDLADFAAFQVCFGSTPSVACACSFDADTNGVIDLADYAAFAAALDPLLVCAPYAGYGPFDFQNDGNVDLTDYAAFQVCLGATPDVPCRCIFDESGDGKVDMDDYLTSTNGFTGPR